MDLNEKLYQLFVKGIDYITLSLTTYRDKYALVPMLTPSDEYLEEGGDDIN
jgi:hypothetical protein